MRIDPENRLGEDTGMGTEGREMRDEFQLHCRFVSEQDGPVVQFRRRQDISLTNVS
ncbi:hypothetical protein M426DRAFT_324907 [Hypoxylon sp. CI-4A]|nr:hypothetical protein M426DRAFT_324907 [Hypoxylon sp. CI-4A]